MSGVTGDPIIASVVTESTFVSQDCLNSRKYDEETPVSNPPSPVRPDNELSDTEDRIRCCGCDITDYFEHTGEPEKALCKHCGHQKCTDCGDA
ncbi:hypothetical protein F4774DRAFT_425701 [Daldinia eschscholtzii]|nr:hypothetical protein F4774DRAFT_425701 [Daldinia eschscholtzii]